MDETVINGANLFFASQLGIPQEGPDQSRNEWLLGLVNGAPYVRFQKEKLLLNEIKCLSSFVAVLSHVG